MKSIISADDDHMVVEVFPQHDLEVTTYVGFVLGLCQNIFKMYIMITDIMSEKTINLAYLIQVVISMFSNNIQYKFTEPWMIDLKLRSKPVKV